MGADAGVAERVEYAAFIGLHGRILVIWRFDHAKGYEMGRGNQRQLLYPHPIDEAKETRLSTSESCLFMKRKKHSLVLVKPVC